MANLNQVRADRSKDSATADAPSRYEDFAKRLNSCADVSPDVPQLGAGRLTFVREKLASIGVQVTLEAVRRWFSGQAMPRRQYAELLAEVLRADAQWLLEGQGTPHRERQRERNALAGGAVNLVAGLIQLDGGVIAFPDENEPFVDVHAIISGRHFPIRVVVADDHEDWGVGFALPGAPSGAIYVGVVRTTGLKYSLYLISPLAIDAGRPDRASRYVCLRDEGVRQISSFQKVLNS
jgi:hypothetical protein